MLLNPTSPVAFLSTLRYVIQAARKREDQSFIQLDLHHAHTTNIRHSRTFHISHFANHRHTHHPNTSWTSSSTPARNCSNRQTISKVKVKVKVKVKAIVKVCHYRKLPRQMPTPRQLHTDEPSSIQAFPAETVSHLQIWLQIRRILWLDLYNCPVCADQLMQMFMAETTQPEAAFPVAVMTMTTMTSALPKRKLPRVQGALAAATCSPPS